MKEKILHEVNEEELTVIPIIENSKEISWEDNGREFTYRGNMYDLVKKQTVNGKQVLYCINDTKEKEFVERSSELTKHNSAQGKRSIAAQSITLFQKNNFPVITHIFTIIHSCFSPYSQRLSNAPNQNTTPPPRA